MSRIFTVPRIAGLLAVIAMSGCWDFNVRHAPPIAGTGADTQLTDVPVPQGLAYLADHSFKYQGPFRTAEVYYRGPVRLDEVVLFYSSEMRIEGWNFLGMTGEGRRLLRFEKGSEACEVSVWREDGETAVAIEIHPRSAAAADTLPASAPR